MTQRVRRAGPGGRRSRAADSEPGQVWDSFQPSLLPPGDTDYWVPRNYIRDKFWVCFSNPTVEHATAVP